MIRVVPHTHKSIEVLRELKLRRHGAGESSPLTECGRRVGEYFAEDTPAHVRYFSSGFTFPSAVYSTSVFFPLFT
jgi:hypothetical protein